MKAVLFDVDDTLSDQVIPFQKAYENYLKESLNFQLSYINEVVIIMMKCLELLSVEMSMEVCIFIVYKSL